MPSTTSTSKPQTFKVKKGKVVATKKITPKPLKVVDEVELDIVDTVEEEPCRPDNDMPYGELDDTELDTICAECDNFSEYTDCLQAKIDTFPDPCPSGLATKQIHLLEKLHQKYFEKMKEIWGKMNSTHQKDFFNYIKPNYAPKTKAKVRSEADKKAKEEQKKKILEARVDNIDTAVDEWFAKVQTSYKNKTKTNKYYKSFRLRLHKGLDKNGKQNGKTKFYRVELNTSDFDLMESGSYPKAVCFIGLGKAKNEVDKVAGRIYKAKDLNAPYIKGGDQAIRGTVAMDDFTDSSFNWLYEHTKKNGLWDDVSTLQEQDE